MKVPFVKIKKLMAVQFSKKGLTKFRFLNGSELNCYEVFIVLDTMFQA